MNVSAFSKVRNFFSQVVDDIKSRRPLTPMEKKVGIVALVVITWITAIYLLHRWHRSEEATAVKQKLGKHNKANNDDLKADGEFEELEDKKIFDEESPLGNSLETSPSIQSTDAKTSKLIGEVISTEEVIPTEEVLSTSLNPTQPIKTSNKAADVVVIPVQKPAGIDQVTIERSFYWGIDKQGNELTLAQLQELKSKFKAYCDEENKKKQFGDQQADLVYVDFNSFGKKHGLLNRKLEVFIRYLILENEIDSYSKSRNGFCLYLTPEAKESDTVAEKGKRFGKKELLDIDEHMVELEKKLPSLDSFNAEEKSIAEKVLLTIKTAHYQRVVINYFTAPTITDVKIKSYDNKAKAVMDQLVNQGVIHSWNSYGHSSSIIMRIDESDPLPSCSLDSKKWRDALKIDEEKQFMKNNQVDSEKWLSLEFTIGCKVLPEKDQKELTKLIDALNQRVSPGPVEWQPLTNYAPNILNKLKQQNLIHSYEKVAHTSKYKVCLKASDSIGG